MSEQRRRGRPVGLLLNPDAVADLLGDTSQSAWAKAANVSAAHLSEMLAGRKGATVEIANRLASALPCRVGTIFPEMVQFRTQVRHFAAPASEDLNAVLAALQGGALTQTEIEAACGDGNRSRTNSWVGTILLRLVTRGDVAVVGHRPALHGGRYKTARIYALAGDQGSEVA